MKLLLDNNLSPRLEEVLTAAGWAKLHLVTDWLFGVIGASG